MRSVDSARNLTENDISTYHRESSENLQESEFDSMQSNKLNNYSDVDLTIVKVEKELDGMPNSTCGFEDGTADSSARNDFQWKERGSNEHFLNQGKKL